MEPVRPEVDRYLLELLTKRTFGACDFYETRQGVCRLTPPLAKELIATSRRWGRLVGRVAEDLAHRLIEPPRAEPLPRLITRPHGRAAAKVRSPVVEAKTPRVVARRCAVCGGATPRREDRTCSEECLRIAKIEQAGAGGRKRKELMRELRAKGMDPTKTPEALAKAAESMRRRKAEQKAWEAEHPGRPNPELYWRDVYPIVKGMQVNRIAKATGLS